MKRKLKIIALGFFLAHLALAPACSPKVGCPANEGLHFKTDRKGNMPSKRGKTQLFPKKMTRRM